MLVRTIFFPDQLQAQQYTLQLCESFCVFPSQVSQIPYRKCTLLLYGLEAVEDLHLSIAVSGRTELADLNRLCHAHAQYWT